ncbi:MAG TPA: sulfotransferase [Gemmatimonadota bacterium]|nr:sulfotransferase [Gemmatimonadota bacterium]
MKLVFVMGCPRSGTTFLLRCLSTLPNARVHAGILIPDRLCHVTGAARDDDPVEDLLYTFRSVLWKVFVSRITSRRYHLMNALQNPSEALSGLRILLGAGELELERYLMVYKEPFMTFAAERFAAHFSRARIIHLIRDGRDCADSLDRTYGAVLSDETLRVDRTHWREVGSEIGSARIHGNRVVPWWVADGQEEEFVAATRIQRCLWMWKEAVVRGRRARGVAGDRYMELRYEDLCRDPATAGYAILDFLDLENGRRFLKEIRGARTASIGVARQRESDTWNAFPRGVGEVLRELGYV